MTMNFGELTFRKGGQPIVGLPLEILDKVGTNLTESYHRNRTAASGLQRQVIDLPDSNSEENKKIIEEISNNVKSKFETFAKEDSWFDADNAVYNTAQELTSDTRVKDLIKYNSQYSRVEKEIDDSKAPEYYKQIRRMKNQAINKGIRNEKGEAQQYQGRAISGDLDISKYIKTANDLITGWKADVKEYSTNPTQFNMDNASDGFKMSFNAFGKTRIEQVGEDEVRNLVYSSLATDPKYNAEITELAELDLFASTGKNQPDADDITAIMIQQAQYSPCLYNQFIVSSPEFATQTKGMTPKAKQDFINKLSSNPQLKQQYLASGIDQFTIDNKAIIGNDPNAYNKIYTHFKKQLTMQAFEGLIDKAAYSNVSTIYDYNESSLDALRYKKFVEVSTTTPIVTKTGLINKESASKYISTKNAQEKQIYTLQSQIANPDTPSLQKEVLRTQLSDLQGLKNRNEFIVNNTIQKLGTTKQELINVSKNELVYDIENIIKDPELTQEVQGDAVNKVLRGGVKWATDALGNIMDKGYYKIYGGGKPNETASKIFDVMSKNDNITRIKTELSSKGINLSDIAINKIQERFDKKLDNNLQDVLDNHQGAIQSLPIIRIGNFGKDDSEDIALKNILINDLNNPTGLFNIISSSNEDKQGTSNIGDSYKMQYTETAGPNKGKTKPWDTDIQFVTWDEQSPDVSGLLTLQITQTNPLTGEKENSIATYAGSNELLEGFLTKKFNQSVIAAGETKNSYKSSSFKAAASIAAATMAKRPILNVGGEPMKNLTLGSALNTNQYTSRQGNDKDGYSYIYPDVTSTVANVPITISTTEDKNGEFHSYVYKGGKRWITIDNAPSKTAVLQTLGAWEMREQAKYSRDAKLYNGIQNLFNLPNE